MDESRDCERDKLGRVIDAITGDVIPDDRVIVLSNSCLDVDTLLRNVVINKDDTDPFNRQPLPPDVMDRIREYGESIKHDVVLIDGINGGTHRFTVDPFLLIGNLFVECCSITGRVRLMKHTTVMIGGSNLLDLKLNDEVSTIPHDTHTFNLELSQGELNSSQLERLKSFLEINNPRYASLLNLHQRRYIPFQWDDAALQRAVNRLPEIPREGTNVIQPGYSIMNTEQVMGRIGGIAPEERMSARPGLGRSITEMNVAQRSLQNLQPIVIVPQSARGHWERALQTTNRTPLLSRFDIWYLAMINSDPVWDIGTTYREEDIVPNDMIRVINSYNEGRLVLSNEHLNRLAESINVTERVRSMIRNRQPLPTPPYPPSDYLWYPLRRHGDGYEWEIGSNYSRPTPEWNGETMIDLPLILIRDYNNNRLNLSDDDLRDDIDTARDVLGSRALEMMAYRQPLPDAGRIIRYW